MPFWTKKPTTNEEYIEQESKKMDEKRNRFLEDYYRKKAEQQSEPDKAGPTRKERLIQGAKKVGRGLKRAYEYEPSEKTKREVKRQLRYVRSEVSELGQLAPKERRRSRAGEGDIADYFDMGSIAGYAASFDPWRNRGMRSGQAGFTNEFEGYADQFDPFKQDKGRKASSVGFDNPLQGYIDAFDPWAKKRRR